MYIMNVSDVFLNLLQFINSQGLKTTVKYTQKYISNTKYFFKVIIIILLLFFKKYHTTKFFDPCFNSYRFVVQHFICEKICKVCCK